jgi:hypothetical protein
MCGEPLKNAKFRSLTRGSFLSTESVLLALIIAKWAISSEVPKLHPLRLFSTLKIEFLSAIVARRLIQYG